MNLFFDFHKQTIQDEYDKIFVSDFIFNECEILKGQNVKSIDAPLLDEGEFKQAYDKCFEISDRLCDAVRKWLEDTYGIIFTMEQVRYVYGSFFDRHVYMIYERYLRVKDLDMDDLCFEIPQYSVTGISSAKCADEGYNAYIYGEILKRMGAQQIGVVSHVNVNRESEKMESMTGRLSLYLKDLITQPRNINYNIRRLNGYRHLFVSPPKREINCRSVLIRTFMPKETEKEIVSEADGKVYVLDPYTLIRKELENYKNKKINPNLRNLAFYSFKPKDEFEKILKAILLRLLPLSLCENICEIYKSILPIAKKIHTKKIYSAARFDGAIALFAAIKSRDGAKIIDIQHSGSYLSNQAMGFSEIHCFDEFITWGNYGDYPYGVVRAVAPVRFSNERIINKSNGNKVERILFVSNDAEKYDLGNGWYDPHFIEKHFRFIRALPLEYREKLVVRLRNDPYGFTKTYEKEFPEVKLEYEYSCSIAESIKKSNLVVVDINSSAYYESLVAGKPTLLFDGIRYPLYHTKMIEWMKRFKDKHIYNEDGAVIAKNISKYGNEIVREWNGADNQDLINDFLDYSMNSEVDIKEAWYKEWVT